MLAGIVTAIIFLVVGIIITNAMLIACSAISIPVMGLGEYYICNFADYYDLKQQVNGLDKVSKELITTNHSLRSSVNELMDTAERMSFEVDRMGDENDRFSESNQLLETQNSELKSSINKLEETMKSQFPGLLEAHKTAMDMLRESALEHKELSITIDHLKTEVAAETAFLTDVRKNLALVQQDLRSEVEALSEAASSIKEGSRAFGELQRLTNSLELILKKEHTSPNKKQ